MPGAFARIAIEAVLQLRKALGRRLDFHRRDVERVADLHHSLRVLRVEADRYRRDLLPWHRAGELLDAIADDAVRTRAGGNDRHERGAKCDRRGQHPLSECPHHGLHLLGWRAAGNTWRHSRIRPRAWPAATRATRCRSAWPRWHRATSTAVEDRCAPCRRT